MNKKKQKNMNKGRFNKHVFRVFIFWKSSTVTTNTTFLKSINLDYFN